MIMYFIATGKQPFDKCNYDAMKITKGIRPEINASEVPEHYINLMKMCWDSNPNNRPDVIELYKSIEFICKSFHDSYFIFSSTEEKQQYYEIKKQFKEAEEYRKTNLSSIKNDKIRKLELLSIYMDNLPEETEETDDTDDTDDNYWGD
ncbi:hypothetical protein C1645_755946 [Glomus cerebriforme]|uniref:Protein kinase domain-containing protein n=1 Tax=Glomus cerebriforme TaxID=658196 RepID=A0A397TGN1_9GLOM|nr:hypothetical protein C1645_755946 [Glomus cerebriforme]